MINPNSPNEYHKYKSTSGSGSGHGPSGAGWIVIAIVGFFFISFLFSGAGWEAIETLLALGLIAYMLFK